VELEVTSALWVEMKPTPTTGHGKLLSGQVVGLAVLTSVEPPSSTTNGWLLQLIVWTGELSSLSDIFDAKKIDTASNKIKSCYNN